MKFTSPGHWLSAIAAVAACLGTAAARDDAQVPASYSASSIVVADFDGDGTSDVAALIDMGRSVRVHLGRSGRGLDRAGHVTKWNDEAAVPEQSSMMTVADLDGDGNLDLTVASTQRNGVAILAGKGDGTFSDAVRVPTAAPPSKVAVADLDADGVPDILVLSRERNTVELLRGRGERRFASLGTLKVGFHPEDILVTDAGSSETNATKDRIPDVVVSVPDERKISLFFGDGSGRFGAPVDYAVSGSYATLLSDLNRDGLPDLVTANAKSSNVGVSVALPKGRKGSFTGEMIPVQFAATVRPADLAARDFDGDGNVDVAVFAESVNPPGSSAVFVLLNRPPGPGLRVVAFETTASCAMAAAPAGIVAGDFNGDGNGSDLAVIDRRSDEIVVFYGDGKGGLSNCDSALTLGPVDQAGRASAPVDGPARTL